MKEKLKAALAWVRETAWPRITRSYREHEITRHAVTFAVGAFVGWAVL